MRVAWLVSDGVVYPIVGWWIVAFIVTAALFALATLVSKLAPRSDS